MRHQLSILSLLLLLVGCNTQQGPLDSIPLKGNVVYDVTYSDDIRGGELEGALLPHKIYGTYDTCNVRLSIKAPLGFGNADIVLGQKEDYLAVNVDGAKLVVPLASLVDADEAEGIASNLKAKLLPSKADISGYMSDHVVIYPDNADSLDTHMDIFYVPFPGVHHYDNALDYFADKQQHRANSLGLVTAISLQTAETNIMLVISEVSPDDNIKPTDFDCPRGYVQATKDDLIAVYNLLNN